MPNRKLGNRLVYVWLRLAAGAAAEDGLLQFDVADD